MAHPRKGSPDNFFTSFGLRGYAPVTFLKLMTALTIIEFIINTRLWLRPAHTSSEGLIDLRLLLVVGVRIDQTLTPLVVAINRWLMSINYRGVLLLFLLKESL